MQQRKRPQHGVYLPGQLSTQCCDWALTVIATALFVCLKRRKNGVYTKEQDFNKADAFIKRLDVHLTTLQAGANFMTSLGVFCVQIASNGYMVAAV
ncbi:hypothetical protein BV22DRAFT_1134044 [Leucogyrophana mollusca]|uniref:Uncharacterized protein n=1 Tax=Leucogyrophana mollusca TaxID=85980 RepID=A0ACB8B0G7_9AGAM|nr:hypothetical protein BV22DRAFT_1134044 [Leucogyrophana mollusca]